MMMPKHPDGLVLCSIWVLPKKLRNFREPSFYCDRQLLGRGRIIANWRVWGWREEVVRHSRGVLVIICGMACA